MDAAPVGSGAAGRPADRRPRGQGAGGGIWLHLDRGSGTSGCVSLSAAGMRHLLRALDPRRRPVVVMAPGMSVSSAS
ncbi:hypothetical protein [Streptomyces sp. AJS327]|uniref:hypothetical protein n=1 Tax=Streptomyces sp. AJS327 TaxID=2545265 RepID=UPI0035B54637